MPTSRVPPRRTARTATSVRLTIAAVLLGSLSCAPVGDPLPAPPYWGDLAQGPHPVGFQQRWLIDSTRRLPGGDSLGMNYRPVLMNIWYPATAAGPEPMPYGDYLDGMVRAADPSEGLGRYATALRNFELDVMATELLDAERDSLTSDQQEQFTGLLGTSTAVGRDARMRRGRHPVVFYTQGSRSSYDDNIVLGEFFASHGIVVIGSAFPAEDNSELATSASDESRQRDIRRLLLEAHRVPGLEVGSAIGIGHSAGAQALLLFAADPSIPLDAILALDTTQDYATLFDGTWAYYTDRVVSRRKKITTPIMMVASPEALFELADSLQATPRWLVTAPNLGHNDFISQGIMAQDLLAGTPDDDAAEREAAHRSYVGVVRHLRDWVLAFDTGGLAAAAAVRPSEPLQGTYLAVGEGAPVYRDGSVPTAREVRHLFSTAAPEQFVDAVMRARDAGAVAGNNEVLSMLLAGSITGGNPGRARRMFGTVVERDSTARGIVDKMASRARLFARYDVDELAEEWWGIAEALDPGVRGRETP